MGGQGRHDPGPDRGGLGPGKAGGDGGHDVPAEGRAGLPQDLLLGIDGQLGAVRGQSQAQPPGQAGGQVPALVGGSDEQDLGLGLPDHLGRGLGPGQGQVVAQKIVLRQVDRVRPTGDELGAQVFHAPAQEQGGHLLAQVPGQSPGPAQQFQAHRVEPPSVVFHQDPDPGVIQEIRDGPFLGVGAESPFRTGLDAGPAQGAAFVDQGLALGQFHGLVGAGP